MAVTERDVRMMLTALWISWGTDRKVFHDLFSSCCDKRGKAIDGTMGPSIEPDYGEAAAANEEGLGAVIAIMVTTAYVPEHYVTLGPLPEWAEDDSPPPDGGFFLIRCLFNSRAQTF